MKKSFLLIMFSVLVSISVSAQGWKENYGGVMLQGFYWDSYAESQWTVLERQSDELAEYFDLIWVPQSGYCNTTSNQMGYAPIWWFNHQSAFGSEQQLRKMIKTYRDKGVGIIEDVVINHRNGNTNWCDFPTETWNGKTLTWSLADICKGDDGGKTEAAGYAVTGAADTGTDFDGSRDLDHTSANVQENIKTYLDFLLNDLGYAGFRYDMVKGYAPKYTGMYNAAVKPGFSVGEYWDGNVNLVKNWIDGTKVDGVPQSAAFDFPMKYKLNTCCNTSGKWNTLAQDYLALDKNYQRYSVTFVDNHDTYRDGNKLTRNIEAANAFILSMPGTPCVFLPHWTQYKSVIKQLIAARKTVGVTNQSDFTIVNNTTSTFAVRTEGSNGRSLVAVIGMGFDYNPGEGWTKVLSGTYYTVYLSDNCETVWASLPSGKYSTAQTVTLNALSASADAKIVYTTDGTEPTATSRQIENGGKIEVTSDMTLKAALLVAGAVKGNIVRNYSVKEFEPYTATVYLKDPGWSKVCFYAWDATGAVNDTWPGKQVTDKTVINGETFYYRTFTVGAEDYTFNVIFNIGDNTGQTVDILALNSDAYFEIASTTNKYTVNDITAAYTGIEEVKSDKRHAPSDVYSLDGRMVRRGTLSVDGLPRGIYIVGGKKVVVK